MQKYPSTLHVQQSHLQPGESAGRRLGACSLSAHWLVIEEKLDGANCAISFIDNKLHLQSRGHYLQGGPREEQFDLFKAWARHHELFLLERLGNRFILYGEWLYAKHTIFYNALAHYFYEFDIWDTEAKRFLSTFERHQILQGGPVMSVPVLYQGWGPKKLGQWMDLLLPSVYCNIHEIDADFTREVERAGAKHTLSLQQTLLDGLSEGLYIKIETLQGTVGRYKWVRTGFIQTISESDSHWHDRPLIVNRIPLIDVIYESTPPKAAGIFSQNAPVAPPEH